MLNANRLKKLEDLGFSNFEAQVYYMLLKESPQSTYKIANSIGKSNSNTSLALNNLIVKGAVTLLEGKKIKEYSSVPLDEFLELRVLKAKQQQEDIRDAFKDVESNSQDDQIFYLTSKDQLFLKAKYMIGQAEKTILVDGSPKEVEFLRKDLEKKGKEGVVVLIESRLSTPINHCKNVITEFIGDYSDLGFNWLVISVDLTMTLISTLTVRGKFVEGLWVSNKLLSEWFYNGMFYEITHRNNLANIKSNLSSDNIIKSMKDFHEKYRIKKPLNS